MPSWWPWLVEGMALFTGVNLAYMIACGLRLARMSEEGDRLFVEAHRRGDLRLMHELAEVHQRLKQAIATNQVTVVVAALAFLIELSLYFNR